jgi:hypothetical protein
MALQNPTGWGAFVHPGVADSTNLSHFYNLVGATQKGLGGIAASFGRIPHNQYGRLPIQNIKPVSRWRFSWWPRNRKSTQYFWANGDDFHFGSFEKFNKFGNKVVLAIPSGDFPKQA